jgi:hypothetical protein
MKFPLLIALLCTGYVAGSAAETKSPASESKPASAQTGRTVTARLLATGRVTGKEAPDGLRFMFLLTRAANVTGSPALKETRDFRLSGASYQEKTQAELGKKFEPVTVFEPAEKFFANQPRLQAAADLTAADVAGAYILTIEIAGVVLPADGKAEVAVQAGFGTEVEPFTFEVKVPRK